MVVRLDITLTDLVYPSSCRLGLTRTDAVQWVALRRSTKLAAVRLSNASASWHACSRLIRRSALLMMQQFIGVRTPETATLSWSDRSSGLSRNCSCLSLKQNVDSMSVTLALYQSGI